MTTKKQKRMSKRAKDRKRKIGRVLNLIDKTSKRRGDQSEESVIEALKSLPGAISYKKSKKYSVPDKRGIDFIITIKFNGKEKITFPLQTKSSLSLAREFVEQGNGEIPVLVKNPGATKQSIINALSRIIERKQKGDKRIIEMAELDLKH